MEKILNHILAKLTDLETGVSGVKQEVSGLKEEVAGIRNEHGNKLNSLEKRMGSLETEMKASFEDVNKRLNITNIQVGENTEQLKEVINKLNIIRDQVVKNTEDDIEFKEIVVRVKEHDKALKLMGEAVSNL